MRRSVAIVFAVTAVMAGAPAAALPATFTAACSGTRGDADSLKSAITAANTAEGNDSVALGAGCRYVLGAPDNFWYGPNGLPPIVSDITIEGNGATIARVAGAAAFRLLFVGADPAVPTPRLRVARRRAADAARRDARRRARQGRRLVRSAAVGRAWAARSSARARC